MNNLLISAPTKAYIQAEEAFEGSFTSLVLLGVIYCILVLA